LVLLCLVDYLRAIMSAPPDSQDGFKLFNMAGFTEFYSGTAEWHAAAGIRQ
jgi:hypothetical protein